MMLIKGVGLPLISTTILILCRIGFGGSFVWSSSGTSYLQRKNLLQTRYTFGLQDHPRDNHNERDVNNAIDQLDELDDFRVEQEAGRKVAHRLMLPRMIVTSISQSISALAWGFLLVSFILQIFGYAFVMDSFGFRIDTLEARQFQDEIMKSVKEMRR
jgi:hypothetical protein